MFICPDDLGNFRYKPSTPLQKLLGAMIEDDWHQNHWNQRQNFFIFCPWETKLKHSNFQKVLQIGLFFVFGVFGYEKHEFEGIFEFWPQEGIIKFGLKIDFELKLESTIDFPSQIWTKNRFLNSKLSQRSIFELKFELKIDFSPHIWTTNRFLNSKLNKKSIFDLKFRLRKVYTV